MLQQRDGLYVGAGGQELDQGEQQQHAAGQRGQRERGRDQPVGDHGAQRQGEGDAAQACNNNPATVTLPSQGVLTIASKSCIRIASESS